MSLPPYQPPQYYAPPPVHSRTLGIVAFVVGAVVFIASPIVSIVTGSIAGPLEVSGGFAANFAVGASGNNPQLVGFGLLIAAQLLLGSGLGIWALVQGIVAVRTQRGRGWGIVAIVLAGVAPVLSFILYVVMGVATRTVSG